jgi:hypothetical protein
MISAGSRLLEVCWIFDPFLPSLLTILLMINRHQSLFHAHDMHDYADTVWIDILSRLARAMAPDSRVLICDIVLP